MVGRYFVRKTLRWIETGLGIPVFPRDRILCAVSDDGLRWRRVPGVVVDVGGEHGSEMVYWPHVVSFGDVRRMYFMGSHLVNGRWRERILSAVSSDGESWKVEPGERVAPGGEFDLLHAFAPCVVRTGDSWRMYYSGKDADGVARILSAVSVDGVQWEKDGDVRVAPGLFGADSVYGASVVHRSGRWLMVFTCRRGHDTWLALAVSDDGLEWVPESTDSAPLNPGPRLHAESPSVVELDGKYRLYFTGYDGSVYGAKIYCMETSDWRLWSSPVECLDHGGPFERHGVNFCHVAREKSGGWTMFYTGFWGWHLLSPYTKFRYIRKARLNR